MKQEIENAFSNVEEARNDWSFTGERSIERFTHGYHRYPAKFLPQLVKKIIENYCASGDVVGDFFAGCGTTLVESKAHGLKSYGVDINPVANLITKAKINPLDPFILKQEIAWIRKEIKYYKENSKYCINLHDRINYWFRPKEKNCIAFLCHVINEIDNENLRNYFLCALSNILKNSSRWLQTGTKPQIDPDKIPADPLVSFEKHMIKMQSKNCEFYTLLKQNNWLEIESKMILSDARHSNIEDEILSTIITSPPYVTSYEYADIHQLTGYWFNFFNDLASFRKDFIGTFHSNVKAKTEGEFSNEIYELLLKKDNRLANEIANYFESMSEVILEIKRVLKPNGIVCVVIGNTTMKGVRIKTAEAFTEYFVGHNFKILEIIKRKINHKIMPTIRDKLTGKFTGLKNKNKQLIYPEEYIIIARKEKNELLKQGCQN